MSRIICLGNRLVAGDTAGPAVYDALLGRVPAGHELIDAGTPGLRLLNLLDGCQRAVLVDGVAGFGSSGVRRLDCREIVAQAGTDHGHGVGPAEVLRWLPLVCDRAPEVVMVGIEGPPTPAIIERAAALAAALAGEV